MSINSHDPLPNLWVLSMNSSNYPMKLCSDQCIIVDTLAGHNSVLIGFIYAQVRYIPRRILWSELLNFQQGPLLLLGDFNAVLGVHERSISNPPNTISCQKFADFISSVNLSDIPTFGNFFTWSNRRFASGYIEAWLDRSLANS